MGAFQLGDLFGGPYLILRALRVAWGRSSWLLENPGGMLWLVTLSPWSLADGLLTFVGILLFLEPLQEGSYQGGTLQKLYIPGIEPNATA